MSDRSAEIRYVYESLLESYNQPLIWLFVSGFDNCFFKYNQDYDEVYMEPTFFVFYQKEDNQYYIDIGHLEEQFDDWDSWGIISSVDNTICLGKDSSDVYTNMHKELNECFGNNAEYEIQTELNSHDERYQQYESNKKRVVTSGSCTMVKKYGTNQIVKCIMPMKKKKSSIFMN